MSEFTKIPEVLEIRGPIIAPKIDLPEAASDYHFTFTPDPLRYLPGDLEKALSTRRLRIDVWGEEIEFEVTEPPALHVAPDEPISIEFCLRKVSHE